MARQIMVALERSEAEAPRQQPKKDDSTPADSNTFTKTDNGDQSIAQGTNPIGTQINNYYASQPEDAKPQPASAVKVKIELEIPLEPISVKLTLPALVILIVIFMGSGILFVLSTVSVGFFFLFIKMIS
ncbi:MAG: hypothetical protein D3910_15660 [Candidatus Electrothrix sp. ATG2]|nr:hypothetical protein [Candidatus Electrothrix sp. ATG2]